MKKIISGICAGILISLGGAIFLSCENRIVGAFLFGIALLCICFLGYALYTGRICYIPENPTKDSFATTFLGLLGNLIGTVVCGLALRFAVPKIGEAAETLCSGKFSQTFPQTLIRGIFCGIIIYLAVEVFKKHDKNVIAIIFGIPCFILSGFEHSIADMFYFAAGNFYTLRALGFIGTVVLGNTIGGMLLPVLGMAMKPKKN